MTSLTRRRVRVMAVMLLASTSALAGCGSGGLVCTAIGYTATLRVDLADPREGLTLELCDGADCTPAPPDSAQAENATVSPISTGVMSITGSSASGWSAVFVGGQPEIGYRLTDATGVIVGEGYAEVTWVRVSGDERCGGNREASIEL